ncbi:MAG: transcription antitermination factor NusB [Oscillospiraceae bacterium]|jgi:N utilization substance protein B|nr:transcription antitermination factor NusB [Oscillospiraceae bacterium]
MKRSTAREVAMHIVFELDFNSERSAEVIGYRMSEEGFASFSDETEIYKDYPGDDQKPYILRACNGVYEHMPELDGYLEKYSVKWSFDRISKVSKSILRLCMFELLYMPEIPPKASINEAVELCKKYDDEELPAYVNGVLGAFMQHERSGF